MSYHNLHWDRTHSILSSVINGLVFGHREIGNAVLYEHASYDYYELQSCPTSEPAESKFTSTFKQASYLKIYH